MDALKALVTSEARARVLAALFAEPDRPFYQHELARVSGLRLVAVQRELRRLVSAGLVRASTVAGRRVYAPDRSSAIHDELRSIVLKLRGPVPILRDALAMRRGVELAWIFGSFASGDATAASDIDVMVLGNSAPRDVRTGLGRAERQLERSVNEHVIARREWTTRLVKRDPFISNVRHGPKLWLIGDDAALAVLDRRLSRR